MLSAIIYGIALTMLFFVSTFFHCVFYCNRNRQLKDVLHRCDRAMIYIFIAGSYYPWLSLGHTSHPQIVSVVKWCVWVMAVLGIIYQQVKLRLNIHVGKMLNYIISITDISWTLQMLRNLFLHSYRCSSVAGDSLLGPWVYRNDWVEIGRTSLHCRNWFLQIRWNLPVCPCYLAFIRSHGFHRALFRNTQSSVPGGRSWYHLKMNFCTQNVLSI